MSDIYESDEEAILGGSPSAPAPPAEETPPEAPQTPPEASQEERLYAGKYKSVDDLEKAYSEAQRLISQTRPAEAQQPQQQADPMTFLPPQIDEATFKRIESSAERDPQGTALWALENQQYLGSQITNACMRNWYEQDFLGYERWRQEQTVAYWDQRQQERQAPIDNYTYHQISQSAVAEAGNGIPDFEAYKPLILQAIEENQHISEYVKSVTHDPQQLAKAIEWVYATVKGNEYVQQLRSQPPKGQQTPAVDSQKIKAQSERRSTASPDPNQSRDKALQDMILNAKP